MLKDTCTVEIKKENFTVPLHTLVLSTPNNLLLCDGDSIPNSDNVYSFISSVLNLVDMKYFSKKKCDRTVIISFKYDDNSYAGIYNIQINKKDKINLDYIGFEQGEIKIERG